VVRIGDVDIGGDRVIVMAGPCSVETKEQIEQIAGIVAESGDRDLAAGLSIGKCRTVFDAARPEIQAALLAALLGTPAEPFVAAGRLGDNLLRAMLDKGMARHAAAFAAFGDRRRQ